MLPAMEMSKRVGCGHDVPPDTDAGWRMSATIEFTT
jgi:hypothetical protein